MSYVTFSSQEKPLFQKRIPWWHLFILLCSYFRAHSTTLLLKILGERMHGPTPPQIFWGPSPSPPRSPPMCRPILPYAHSFHLAIMDMTVQSLRLILFAQVDQPLVETSRSANCTLSTKSSHKFCCHGEHWHVSISGESVRRRRDVAFRNKWPLRGTQGCFYQRYPLHQPTRKTSQLNSWFFSIDQAKSWKSLVI